MNIATSVRRGIRLKAAWQRAVALAAALALAAWLAMLAWVYWRQESLLFQPEPLPAEYRLAQPDVQELRIAVEGATLSAMHLKLPHPKGVVFFLHGNGGNLATWFTNAAFYRRANYDLFMLDYRGYGKSSGHIESEAQLRADVRRAWDAVAPQYQGKRRVIYGRSLGTALAAGLAAQVQPDLTVLVSPYWSMSELARTRYPLLPPGLLRYPLATHEDVARIRTPLMLVHGELDPLIPINHSERLARLAPQAQFLRVPGAGHDDVHRFERYLDALAQRLGAL